MYVVVCRPKAIAKATGPIVFKFSQKLNLRPEWMHNNLFGNFTKLTLALPKNLNFSHKLKCLFENQA